MLRGFYVNDIKISIRLINSVNSSLEFCAPYTSPLFSFSHGGKFHGDAILSERRDKPREKPNFTARFYVLLDGPPGTGAATILCLVRHKNSKI